MGEEGLTQRAQQRENKEEKKEQIKGDKSMDLNETIGGGGK
jgi:hypothetical protein